MVWNIFSYKFLAMIKNRIKYGGVEIKFSSRGNSSLQIDPLDGLNESNKEKTSTEEVS